MLVKERVLLARFVNRGLESLFLDRTLQILSVRADVAQCTHAPLHMPDIR